MSIITTIIASENPFFQPFATLHGTPPFDKIKTEHYEPAFIKAMEIHQAEIDGIVANREVPTFQNTIVAMEFAGEMLNRVSAVFFNLLSAESNDEMMEISQRISPLLSEHSNNITLNEQLFERVQTVYNMRFTSGLTPEQIRLTEHYFQRFENSGATLVGEDREIYRRLSTELAQATLNFGQNNLRAINAFEMLLTDETEIVGLPQDVLDAAAIRAREKGKSGWLFNLSAPSFTAFMRHSARRDLREKLFMAFHTRTIQGNEFDNQENVRTIVNHRLQMANLFGHRNFAEFVLKNKMAKNPETVFRFLENLSTAYSPTAKQEVKDFQAFASNIHGKPFEIQQWDWNFYAEQLRNERFDLNDEMTRPYFELENVKRGVFGLATHLWGLTFVKNPDIAVYHPEVDAFEVFDEDGTFLAVLYTDFHPRSGKRSGAWMTSFRNQFVRDGENHRPHISIVMNFTRPTETRPALLTFDEVDIFLHEMGHALHGILSNVTYPSLAGTNVYRDFVEMPSHLMENWLREVEFLDTFAFHFETGKPMPAELVQRIIDAANFKTGFLCLRQLGFGYLDMAWHTLEEPFDGDIRLFEQKAMQPVRLLPIVPAMSISTQFDHIFSGGYAAGYYSYKWAAVLEADAFSLFQKYGIFNRETARSLRKNILERGNTEDPMALFIRFRGQEPSIDAKLRRSGIE